MLLVTVAGLATGAHAENRGDADRQAARAEADRLWNEYGDDPCCACAAEAALKSLRRYPNDPEVLIIVNRFLYAAGDIAAAENYATTLLAVEHLMPYQRAYGHFGLAQAAFCRGDWATAEAQCLEALSQAETPRWYVLRRANELLREVRIYQGLAQWPTEDTAHLVCHFAPERLRGPDYPTDLATYTAERERAYTRIATTLGVSLNSKIHVYVFPSREHGRHVLGREAGFALARERRIIEYPGMSPGHELAHVLAAQLGPLCMRSAFLNEGLAGYLDQTSASWHDKRLRRALAQPVPPLLSLERDFYSFPTDWAYPMATSFVELLVDRYGWDKFKRLWIARSRGALDEAVFTAYGLELAQLDAIWRQRLADVQRAGATE